jgi:hypothetical protein
LTVLAASADALRALAADVRLNVYVTCDGSDIVGAHLCFRAKKKRFGSTLGLSVPAPLSTHGLGERLGRGRRSGRLVARNESRAARRDERGQDAIMEKLKTPNDIGERQPCSAEDVASGPISSG